MDMDQRLLRHRACRAACSRRSSSRPAARRRRAAGRRRLHALGELRVDADADIAGIVRMAVVEQVLAAEGAADRQVVGLGEARGCRRTASASQPPPPRMHERPLGRGQQLAQLAPSARAPGCGRDGLVGRRRRRPSTRSVSMSSGSASTTGPGRPATARWKAWLTSSGMRAASSISPTHLAIGPNMRRIVDLLERLALAPGRAPPGR